MADIYLYGGAANLNDIILRDPTTLPVHVVTGGAGILKWPTRRRKTKYEEDVERAVEAAEEAIASAETLIAVDPQNRDRYYDLINPVEKLETSLELLSDAATQRAIEAQAVHIRKLTDILIDRMIEDEEEEVTLLLS